MLLEVIGDHLHYKMTISLKWCNIETL